MYCIIHVSPWRSAPERNLWYTKEHHFRTLFIYLLHPSDALDHIARRLISTQAVRDSKDRYAAHGRFFRLQ